MSCRVFLLLSLGSLTLSSHFGLSYGLGFIIGSGWGTGSNQTLPPDASPIATPHFDVHAGRCPAIKFDCDNKPIRYYCVSDLTCFSFQKCCLYSCSYVCTIATTGGWKSADDANTGVALPGESSAPPADASVSVQKNELAEVTL